MSFNFLLKNYTLMIVNKRKLASLFFLKKSNFFLKQNHFHLIKTNGLDPHSIGFGH